MKKFIVLFLTSLSIINFASAADEIKCKLVVDSVGKIATLLPESKDGDFYFTAENGDYKLTAWVSTTSSGGTTEQPYTLVMLTKKKPEGEPIEELMRAYGTMADRGGYEFNASINYFAVETVCARLKDGDAQHRSYFFGGTQE